MLRPRFAFAFSALAGLLACSDDDPATAPSNNLTFEGVSWIALDETGKMVVSWKAAPEAVEYRVYISRIQGRELKAAPAAKTAATSVVITPETLGEKYYVTVRAADARGYEDRNNIVKSVVATPDKTAPTFDAPRVDAAGNAGVRVSWDPAKDDFSPPEAITYEVYAGRTRNSITRVAKTAPGVTSVELNQLGSPSETFLFAVRARDIAGNESSEVQPVSATLSQDATPPVFGGCDTAMKLGPDKAEVTWSPANDNHSPAASLTYKVFLSTASKGFDLNAPVATVTNGTSATLNALQPGLTYFVLCKATDVAGNVDANTTERSFTTDGDLKKPLFAGINAFNFDKDKRTVELKWNPGSDNETPSNLLLYDVFEATSPGKQDFNGPPRATSTPGATSIVVTDLMTRSTLYWVVRARDAIGNRDDNVVERSGTTTTSFAVDVQGVFNRNCAVVGCHVTGPQAGGLNLSPAFSYASLVEFPSNQNRPSVRISKNKDPQSSWLYLKITDPAGKGGLLMPAPQTGNVLSNNDKEIITSWILLGAPDN